MTAPTLRPLTVRTRAWCARTVSAAGLVVAVAYVGTVVTANWATVHWPPLVLGPLVVPAGTLWAGMVFTLRDLLHDTWGTRGVIAGVAAGAGVSWLLATPQIAAASVAAFTVSETVDAAVYAVLRHRSRLAAVAVSNLAGLLIDSLLFVPLAFGTVAAVPGQLAGKLLATILTLVLLRLVWPGRRVVAR